MRTMMGLQIGQVNLFVAYMLDTVNYVRRIAYVSAFSEGDRCMSAADHWASEERHIHSRIVCVL